MLQVEHRQSHDQVVATHRVVSPRKIPSAAKVYSRPILTPDRLHQVSVWLRGLREMGCSTCVIFTVHASREHARGR